jgi:putative ABC transport system permease protein
VRNLEVDFGSFITDQQVASADKVIVLGPVARDDLFGTDAGDVTGQIVRVKGIEFKVIGVLKAKGGSGFGNADDWTYVPISTAQRFLTGDQYVSTISIEATDANSMAPLQQGISDLLMSRHHIDDPTKADFSTLNQADIVSTASGVAQTFTILLAAVAGISLVVGGIGIMNMMLTSVTERTKEIGLRKAIGAKNSEISIQFLTEAVFITLIGGVIGVALGLSISFAMSYFGILETTVTLFPIFLAFGVSAVIGVAFGYYPARKAAALNPIEALRFE